jgi:phosphatidylethanolamine-binding protein (PEBP) family uncharacterized protein
MKKILLLASLIIIVMVIYFLFAYNGDFEDLNLDVPVIEVHSKSIEDGKLLGVTAADKKINKPHGQNTSPAVSWQPVNGAMYYAVVIFDETANWLHFFQTDITGTMIEEGQYFDKKSYIGPYPPKSSGDHTYRIEVFAIKSQPKDSIGKIDSRTSYRGLIKHLNQVGGNSDNILARGYIKGTYGNGD